MRPTSSRVGGFLPNNENIQLAQDYQAQQQNYQAQLVRDNQNSVQQLRQDPSKSIDYPIQDNKKGYSNPVSVLAVRNDPNQQVPLSHRRSMPGHPHQQDDDYMPLVMLNPPIAQFDEEDR